MCDNSETMESLRAELTSIRSLLEVLINGEKLHQVGGYAHGRTSRGDAFIILYPAEPFLKHKICRVYEEEFSQLPPTVDTKVPPQAQEGNPDRDQARRQRIYRPCPPFTIATRDGKETQMGPEVRFARIVELPLSLPSTGHPMPEPSPRQELPTRGKKRRANTTDSRGPAAMVAPAIDWREEAIAADAPLLFDTALFNLEPWFQSSEKVATFREALFGPWNPAHRAAYIDALLCYAMERQQSGAGNASPDAHQQAKQVALNRFHELTETTPDTVEA